MRSSSTSAIAAHPTSLPDTPHTEIRIHPITGEPYRLAAIVTDLFDPDWYIRIRAAWALGRTRDIEAIVPLVEALNDENKVVRDLAQEALRAMETTSEPLAVRVLLCETVDDSTRTDMLLSLTGVRNVPEERLLVTARLKATASTGSRRTSPT